MGKIESYVSMNFEIVTSENYLEEAVDVPMDFVVNAFCYNYDIKEKTALEILQDFDLAFYFVQDLNKDDYLDLAERMWEDGVVVKQLYREGLLDTNETIERVSVYYSGQGLNSKDSGNYVIYEF